MSDGQTDAAEKLSEEVFKAIIYTEDPAVKRNPLQLAFHAIHFDDSEIVYAGFSKFWYNRVTNEWCRSWGRSNALFPANVWEQARDRLKDAINGVSRIIAERGLCAGRVGDASVADTVNARRDASSVDANVGTSRRDTFRTPSKTYNGSQPGHKNRIPQAPKKPYKRPHSIVGEERNTMHASPVNKTWQHGEGKTHTRCLFKKRCETNPEHVSCGSEGTAICVSD